MRAAYIGILTPGTTSRMRAERLRGLVPGAEWQWMDTDPPLRRCARLWRSLAFRTKWGPAISAVNQAVRAALSPTAYDLVWVDKGVFLTAETMAVVRGRSRKLVHFTPDTSFLGNRSRHFEQSLGLYDLVVTTKSFEVGEYQRRGVGERLCCLTQGYDPSVHWPRCPEQPRRRELAFIGLAEPDREACLALLLDKGLSVRLGGQGWKRFLQRYEGCAHLHFAGERVFGEAYAEVYSRAWIGLGLLSKRFPELHTTRTFEIPACGAILATEGNGETKQFFTGDEALFFDDYHELATIAAGRLAGPEDALDRVASAGYRKVMSSGRDYDSLLRSVLHR